MDKRFWAIIGVIVLIFVGFLLFKGNGKNGDSGSAQPTNHVTGLGQKHVTLVEYGDYQCPYCGTYYPVVKQVVEKYNNDIIFQFRNLPLSQIHPNAFAAARAAEAAGMQNKYWEMHDLLYQNQTAWSGGSATNAQKYFKQFAQGLGLNVNQFQTDAASSKVNDAINADVAAFNKTGAETATPAFFLDGKQVKPTNTLDAFSKIIDAEIAKKQ